MMNTGYSEGEILAYLGNSFAESVEDLSKVSLSLTFELVASPGYTVTTLIWLE